MTQYMQPSDRKVIESMAGSKQVEIARVTGFSVSAIYKEIKRNSKPYRALAANELAKNTRVNKTRRGWKTKKSKRPSASMKKEVRCNCRGTGRITFYSDHKPMSVDCRGCG